MPIVSCSVEGCEKARHYSNGLCPMHYQRLKNHGTLEIQKKPTECHVCGEAIRGTGGRGLCTAHYERFFRIFLAEDCSISGCGKISLARVSTPGTVRVPVADRTTSSFGT